MRLVKRGRRKLGRTYAQPVQKRLGRVSVEGFFFFSKTFFCTVIVYFYACRFYTSLDELNVSGLKY